MDLLDEIAQKKLAVDEARPMPTRIVAELASWFERELAMSVQLLEGERLSRPEVLHVLERGAVLRNVPQEDQRLVVNHGRALELQARLSYQAGGVVTERTVTAFHSVLYKGIDRRPGQYREGPLQDDLAVPAPDAAKSHVSMSALSGWLRRSEPSVDVAIDAHLRLRTIRPFEQGNAAVALLLGNLILNRAGYPPIVVREEDLSSYRASLRKAMSEGDRLSFRETMLNLLRQSLDVCLVGAAGSLVQQNEENRPATRRPRQDS